LKKQNCQACFIELPMAISRKMRVILENSMIPTWKVGDGDKATPRRPKGPLAAISNLHSEPAMIPVLEFIEPTAIWLQSVHTSTRAEERQTPLFSPDLPLHCPLHCGTKTFVTATNSLFGNECKWTCITEPADAIIVFTI